VTLSRRPYATDLTDGEWQLLAQLIPAPNTGGRPLLHDRELVNAMTYWLRAGCAWRLLPMTCALADRLPLLQLRAAGIVGTGPRCPARPGADPRQGRRSTPSVAILDSPEV
jgi:hypothetical protein